MHATSDSGHGWSDRAATPLQITTQADEDSLTIGLSGDLDVTSAELVETVIRESQGRRRIAIDLSEVTFIDSTGLMVLLEAKKRNKGQLSVGPSKHESVTRLLELTGTSELLK